MSLTKRFGRLFRPLLFVLCLAVVASTTAARAAGLHLTPVRIKHRAAVYAVYKKSEKGTPSNTQALRRIGRVLEDRGAFVTMELSPHALSQLKREHRRVEALGLGQLTIQGIPFDLRPAGGGSLTRPDLGKLAGYYIIQFDRPPATEQLQAIADLGARKEASAYFSNYGYLYWLAWGVANAVGDLDFVHAVVPFYPTLKGPIAASGQPLVSLATTHTKWQVAVAAWADLAETQRQLEGRGLKVSQPIRQVGGRVTFVLEGPEQAAFRATELPEVWWLEPIRPAIPALTVARKLHQKGTAGACTGTLDEVPVWAGGITGAGPAPSSSGDAGTEQIIGVLDTTFIHQDLSCSDLIPNRTFLKYSNYRSPTCDIQNFSTSCMGGDPHGTSVAGIMVGNAAHEGGTTPVEACRIKGQSFGARLWALACGDFLSCLNFCHQGSIQLVIDEFFQASYADGSRLSNHSWGTLDDRYNFSADRVDFWAYNNTGGDPSGGVTQKYLWFFAAGNEGPQSSTVREPAGAKDDVTGAAVYNGPEGSCWYDDLPPPECDQNKIVSYSARGPTVPDGRHGPDVAGASQFIFTLYSGKHALPGPGPLPSEIIGFNGTSAATPNLTAMGALLRDWLIQRYAIDDPNAALVKALLLNSGEYIPNIGSSSEDLPGAAQGWGRPNLSNLCDEFSFAGCQTVRSQWQEGTFTATGTQFGPISVQVVASSTPLRCMLAWMDPPNLAGGGALVNNLDLLLTAPDGTCYRGNNFSGAWSVSGCSGNFDTKNVDEGVRIQVPATGVWYAEVIAANIAASPQPWAVVCSGAIQAPQSSLDLTGVTILDSCTTGGPGDGNGVIEPGETIDLPITLANQGTLDLTQISEELSSASAGITIIQPSITWPDISAGMSAVSNPAAGQFQLAPTVPCPSRINLSLNLSSSAGSSVIPFPLFVGGERRLLLLDEDFSQGIPDTWTVVHHGSGTGPASTWTTANPCNRTIDMPFSSPWAIADSECAGSKATMDEELITPSIDASTCSQLRLEFSNQFICVGNCIVFGPERGSQQGYVDVSANGGSTWTNVLSMGSRDDGYPNPDTKYLDLSPNVSNLKVRFHYLAMNGAWWAIDNVKLRCVEPICNVCNP